MQLSAWIYWRWTKLLRWFDSHKSSSYVCWLLNRITPTREPLKTESCNEIEVFCELQWLSVKHRNAYVFSWYFIQFFLFLILRQILMNAKQTLTNATKRLRVITHTHHICIHVNLDLSEMNRIVQVQSTVSKAFRFMLTSIMSFCLDDCLSMLFILVTWQAMFNFTK